MLPFKVNNYVIDELIDWDNYKTDPIFRLTFPQKEMLGNEDFELMKTTLEEKVDRGTLKNHLLRRWVERHRAKPSLALRWQ